MLIPANKKPEFMENIVPGIVEVITAAVCWPVSWYASGFGSGEAFPMIWWAALSVATFVAAAVGTVCAVLSIGYAAYIIAKP